MSDDEVANNGEDGLYIVERILDKRGSGRNAEYFIKWRGYDKPEDNTWEPAVNCDCPDLIKEFEAKRAADKKIKKNARSSVLARRSKSSTTTPTPIDDSSSPSSSRRRGGVTSTYLAPAKKIKLQSSRIVLDSSSDSESEKSSVLGGYGVKNKLPENVATPNQKTQDKKKVSPLNSVRDQTTSDAVSTDNAVVSPEVSNADRTTVRGAAEAIFSVPAIEPETVPLITENNEVRELQQLRSVDELEPLDFKVTKVNGVYNDNGYLMAVVSCDKDDDYRCVELKAVGLQNLDLLVDFLVTRLEV